MKVKDVWESRGALVKVLTCPTLGIEVSWRLKSLAQKFKDLESVFRELAMKYPNSQQSDGSIIIQQDSVKEYISQIEKLLEEEFPLETIPTLTLSEVETANLTTMDLLGLDWLIVNAPKS